MTTAWALPVTSICRDALEHLKVAAAGEPTSADDQNLALSALQNILKELPIHGFVWGKITAPPVALVWSSGTPSVVTLPADYYGQPNISFTQNSANVDLAVITKAQFDAIQDPNYVALYPQMIYISPDNKGYLWPVPSANPSMTITYQAIASDAALISLPDVAQTWTSGLGFWVAYELLTKFKVNPMLSAEIKEKYAIKKRMMLAYSVETGPITFGVAD